MGITGENEIMVAKKKTGSKKKASSKKKSATKKTVAKKKAPTKKKSPAKKKASTKKKKPSPLKDTKVGLVDKPTTKKAPARKKKATTKKKATPKKAPAKKISAAVQKKVDAQICEMLGIDSVDEIKGDRIYKVDPIDVVVGLRIRTDIADEEISSKGESIKEDGQIHPITVWNKPGVGLELIGGECRLLGCEEQEISIELKVMVDVKDELHAWDLQMAENIIRGNFPILDLAEGMTLRKELHEELHPETKQGGTGRGRADDEKAERFTKQAAVQYDVPERQIYEWMSAAKLPEDVKDKIREEDTTAKRNALTRKALADLRKKRKHDKMKAEAQANIAARKSNKGSTETNASPKRKRKKVQVQDNEPEVKQGNVMLIHGDYLDVIPENTNDGEVDLILTDPPYDLDRATISHKERASINPDVEWDNLDTAWVLDLVSCLDMGGQMLIFAPIEAVGEYKRVIQAAGLVYKCTIHFHKTNPGILHRDENYLSSMEVCIWAVTKDNVHFFVPWENKGAAEVHNFVEGPICSGNERLDHPAQKPEWLIERLLKRHSTEGHIVVDPFAGVGTVAAVCKRLGRDCVSSEIDADFAETGNLRLDAM